MSGRSCSGSACRLKYNIWVPLIDDFWLFPFFCTMRCSTVVHAHTSVPEVPDNFHFFYVKVTADPEIHVLPALFAVGPLHPLTFSIWRTGSPAITLVLDTISASLLCLI